MASITRQHQGTYTYLYESFSYRDEQGRPRNRKTKIGKQDPKTGKPLYTPDYLERIRQAGKPLPVSVFDGIDGFEQRMREALDSVRDYGLFYFLKHLAEKTGCNFFFGVKSGSDTQNPVSGPDESDRRSALSGSSGGALGCP